MVTVYQNAQKNQGHKAVSKGFDRYDLETLQITYSAGLMTSHFIYGRNTSGTITEPSAC